MYIEDVPNRGSRPTTLLRLGWREGKKVRKKTIANLSDWPRWKIESFRRLLKDEPLMAPEDVFSIERSLPHGHVETVLSIIKKLGLAELISAKRCRERDLVIGMLAEQLVTPSSKLGTTRLWHSTTLAEELNVGDADEDELYEAMDWLLERQERIERKLADRQLSEGAMVLYDVTSSYFEGRTCPLARWGKDRDGKRGKLIVVYGVLANKEGCPVGVDVYPGNTGDPATVLDQVDKMRDSFGLDGIVLVGDRGMLTQTQIESLKAHPGIAWISALRSASVRRLLDEGSLQLSLFDEQNLAEISSPQFAGERLVACFNPLLAEERRRKREDLLAATERDLQRIAKEVARRTKTPLDKATIGQKVGKVLNRYKVGKHFQLTIEDGEFSFARREEKIQREQQLDGIYVVRTSVPADQLSSEDTVRSYKNLSLLERAFLCMKGMDLLVRPIRHRLEDRVRAHIFLCMLAYYVQWHMRRILAPLLFQDEDLPSTRAQRDPVLPASPSKSVRSKKGRGLTAEGLRVHSLQTLLAELGTVCRHQCRLKGDPEIPLITRHTEPSPLQTRVRELVDAFPGYRS